MHYKKSNIQMKKQVSDMLSVFPREMEQIRDREEHMLQKEVASKQKKN